MTRFKIDASFRFIHEDHVVQFHVCGEITVDCDPDDDPDEDDPEDDECDDFPDDFDGDDPEGPHWLPINYN